MSMNAELSTDRLVQIDTDRDWGLFIDGASVPARNGATFSDISPTTDSQIAAVPDGTAEDVDAAVSAAAAAAASWAKASPAERGATLRKMANTLRANAGELAALDAADAGLPVTAMHNDVAWGADVLELFADWARDVGGSTIPASAEHLHFTTRHPYGVVARIIPFNHPLFFAAAKIAAPIVAGNAVVLKPAEIAPLSALRMAQLFADVLPPGVLSVVVGDGPDVGRALVRHPAIRRIGFIGSEATGRAIQRDAADAGIKDVSLELGGKNAMIVFPDADLDRAAAGAVNGMNFAVSAGQSCGSNSRVLLHESIAEEMTDKIVALLQAVTVGHPLDPDTRMGPLSSPAQFRKTMHYIDVGTQDGATLATGGRRPDLDFESGYFVQPTVFVHVDPASRLGQEEVFGPVLSILTWRTPEEAVAIANGTQFGLTASVWTNDLKTAHRTVRDLQAGYVWINGSSRHFWGMPFGGVKSSGIGREESLEELLSYTQLKSVNVLLD